MSQEIIEQAGIIANVIRSQRRKTIRVQVEAGEVSLIAPTDTGEERLKQVLNKRSDWVQGKIAAQQQWLPIKKRQFVSGESLTYLGRHYRLKVLTAPTNSVKLINGALSVQTKDTSVDHIKALVVDWYKAHALEKLKAKVRRYAKLMGIEPASVGLYDYKARWGSCSHSGHIRFNWRAVIAPNSAVDYIVVHELCHLIEHDHSPAFWRQVKRIMPDFESRREWLKQNSHQLDI